MKKRIYWIVIIICLLAAVLGVAVGLNFATRSRVYTYYADYTAADIFSLVNQEREKAGLPIFKISPELTAAAESKAADMKARGYFSHNAPDGKTPWLFIKAAGYEYEQAGENLAVNFKTPAGVVAGWMESPGHKANILNPKFWEMGIAVVKEGENFLVVQEFGSPSEDEFTPKTGKASYYDYVLKSGWSSKGHLVCAVRDWPRGVTLEVTNLANGKKTTCKVTDYGPEFARHPDRIIDLSSHAFSQIADLKRGVVEVSVVQK